MCLVAVMLKPIVVPNHTFNTHRIIKTRRFTQDKLYLSKTILSWIFSKADNLLCIQYYNCIASNQILNPFNTSSPTKFMLFHTAYEYSNNLHSVKDPNICHLDAHISGSYCYKSMSSIHILEITCRIHNRIQFRSFTYTGSIITWIWSPFSNPWGCLSCRILLFT